MKVRVEGLGIASVVLALAGTLMPGRVPAQHNLRDGAPFNGYTGVTFDTRGYAYDYLVDSSLPQDDLANRKFKTLEAAYAVAPAGTVDKPTVIGIRPDVYLMHVGESAPYSLQVTKNYITILGLTDDRRKVVLADNRGNKQGATNNGYIFDINATGFTMMNLTVVNYCNLDYEYPGDPSKNLKKRTRNGYSLRFWRTIQAADKCMFQLYRIENGVGHQLNDQQQLTGVFKPNTTVMLSVIGTKFTVKGSNSTDGETLSLEGTIAPNSFGGAGVY